MGVKSKGGGPQPLRGFPAKRDSTKLLTSRGQESYTWFVRLLDLYFVSGQDVD